MIVKSAVNINLINGSNIEVKQAEIGDTDVINSIISIDIEESLTQLDNNPVGSLGYNHITINLQSLDGSLMPENSSSAYYGYMNNTAIVTVTVNYDSENIAFGTFYIDKWYSNISSDSRKTVTIEADGHMKLIKDMPMPSMTIFNNRSMNEYIREAISKQNSKLTDRYKISIDNSLDFGTFNTMQLSALNVNTLGEMIEQLQQCSATAIYVDRNNCIATADFETDSNTVAYTLGDCINITNIKIINGSLSDYSGVSVKYSNPRVNGVTEVARLSNQSLQSGTTLISDIGFSSKVFKVNNIAVVSESFSSISIEDVQYSDERISLTINNNSANSVEADIFVYGQTLDENNQVIEKYRSNNRGTAAQVVNNIIPKSLVDNYATTLLKLMIARGSIIEAKGSFDPHLKLGDSVYLDALKTVGKSGVYKVVSLQWHIQTTIRCIAKLIKAIE